MVGYASSSSAGLIKLLQLLALMAAICAAGKPTSATGSASSSGECHPEDRAALLSLAATCHLHKLRRSISSHCGRGSQYDIGDDGQVFIGDDGRVASLYISGVFLGEFPPQICNLTALHSLSLASNNMAGPLPPCVGTHLSFLTLLVVLGNRLSGSIPPQLASLANLSHLDLSVNNFDPAPFPPFLGNLSNLEVLDLSYNSFNSTIPPEWANLHHLRTLSLSGNPLSAVNLTLPISLTSMEVLRLRSLGLHFTCEQLKLMKSTIRYLDISDNHLSSVSLDCFCQLNFPSLFYLNLSHNPLHSRLNPSAVLLTPQLMILDLSSCGLSGQLPSGLVDPLFFMIDVSYNLFTGLEKSPVYNSSAIGLRLSRNKFQGDLGDFLEILGEGLSCYELDVSFNEFTGRVPPHLANWSGLETLKMGNNNLKGEVPAKLGLLTELSTLSMDNNELEGTIPSSLSNCSSLQVLDLSYNMLHGDISQALFSSHVSENLTSLRVLLLNNNHLTGTISQSLGISSPYLQVIVLSNNRLVGVIPNQLHLPGFKKAQTPPAMEVTQDTLLEDIVLNVKGRSITYSYILKILTSIDLSENALSGMIPPQLGELTGLVHLNLSRNYLSGSIPPELSKLRDLESLDLSFNKLTGSIPSELGTLTWLAKFNISFNKGLVGNIPTGTQLEDITSYVGDDKLCGFPKPNACVATNDFHKDIADEEHHHWQWHRFVGWMQGWASMEGIILGFVVGFVWTMVLIHIIKPRFRKAPI